MGDRNAINDFLEDRHHGQTVPPFISAPVSTPWPPSIPGPSLISRVARRQIRDKSRPADTGSIYTPKPEGAATEIVPCLVKQENPAAGMLREEVEKHIGLNALADLEEPQKATRPPSAAECYFLRLGFPSTCQMPMVRLPFSSG